MNHPGNPQDEAIEKVLAGLRDAEAPTGMEARILLNLETRALEARAASPSGWRNSVRIRLFTPAAYMAGAAALASAIALVFFLQSTKHLDAIPLSGADAVVAVASRSPHAPRVLHQQSPSRLPARGTALDKANSGPKAEPLSDEDALALSEMLAPSKPAPPLPLTRQEKLLAEVVHQGEPEELADLRPDMRAKQMEISKAEFHDFFEPPPPVKDNE